MFCDPQTNTLIYEEPGKVLAAIPEARPLHNGYVAFPRTLRNCQIATWLGLPVPPIMDDYDWPIVPGRTPLPHQQLVANFMVLNPKSFNLSDMGTMKTLSTLWAADYLMQRNPGWRALVVCPRSIRQQVWGNELFGNFVGRRTCEIIEGSADKRMQLLSKPADFYIMNYDALKIGARRDNRRQWQFAKLAGLIQERQDLRIIIIDEADAYKDGRTARSRVTRLLLANRDYVWLLTGTPTPTGPADAHGLALFINNAYGESYYNFYRRTMVQLSQFKWIPTRDGYHKARELLQPAIRIDIKDVWLDRPELYPPQSREIELTAQQRKLLYDLKAKLRVETKNGTAIIPANEAASRNKALQIVQGMIYDDSHTAHETDARNRILEAIDVINRSVGKVLIFIGLTSVVELVYKELNKVGITCAKITGVTNDKERNATFESFQNTAAPRVLIADPGTMAHGLNLHAASTVLWYGPTDKTGLYMQGIRRAYRPGQHHPVTVVQLVSTTLEKQIFKRLETNQTLQGTLLDWVKGDQL